VLLDFMGARINGNFSGMLDLLLPEVSTAGNSARPQEAAQPGQNVSPQSPTNETDPLFPVKDHGKWGYMDKTGKMVIPPQYDIASGHSEGLAGVAIGKKWGFIDKTGKMVITPQFDKIAPFSNGLALVKIGGKWGYIDQTGKYIWEPTK
jgi:hypothetical protein